MLLSVFNIILAAGMVYCLKGLKSDSIPYTSCKDVNVFPEAGAIYKAH